VNDYCGAAIGRALEVLVVTCCVSVPLGLWKLVEIVIWLVQHISVRLS
jgi:hypothetical protein